ISANTVIANISMIEISSDTTASFVNSSCCAAESSWSVSSWIIRFACVLLIGLCCGSASTDVDALQYLIYLNRHFTSAIAAAAPELDRMLLMQPAGRFRNRLGHQPDVEHHIEVAAAQCPR